jgi:hypothetical protein
MISVRALVFMGLLAACVPGHSEAPEIGPAEIEAFQAPADQREATYYIRPTMSVPTTADLSRGDVPRDEYGRPYTYEYLGQALPDFSGQLTTGEIFDSAQLEGQWTIIRVWGLWCHDSRGELEQAAQLSDALSASPGDEIGFMSIHVPQNADRADYATRNYQSVGAFFEEAGYLYPTVIDADARLRTVLKIRWTPSYLVIAPDRTVQGFRTSLADAGEDGVEQFVQDIQKTRRIWAASN